MFKAVCKFKEQLATVHYCTASHVPGEGLRLSPASLLHSRPSTHISMPQLLNCLLFNLFTSRLALHAQIWEPCPISPLSSLTGSLGQLELMPLLLSQWHVPYVSTDLTVRELLAFPSICRVSLTVFLVGFPHWNNLVIWEIISFCRRRRLGLSEVPGLGSHVILKPFQH